MANLESTLQDEQALHHNTRIDIIVSCGIPGWHEFVRKQKT